MRVAELSKALQIADGGRKDARRSGGRFDDHGGDRVRTMKLRDPEEIVG